MVESGCVLDGVIFEGKPLVSVKVITYNHGKYIRQCLDGILMQVVNFPYEVIVHDDASPDDTADIIREYAAKYPTVIKPIFQTENQYSQRKSFTKLINDRLQGKYIAQCEGDDYWTDPGKLQMQVDFLEGHPEFEGTAHTVQVVDEYGEKSDDIPMYTQFSKSVFTFHDVECWRLPGQSASLVYKNIFSNLSEEMMNAYISLSSVGDRKLALLLVLYGEIYCFEKTMSAYRYVLTGTSWSSRNKGKFILLEDINSLRKMNAFSRIYFNREYNYYPWVINKICISFLQIFKYHDKKYLLNFFVLTTHIMRNKGLLVDIVRFSLEHPISTLNTVFVLNTT